MGLLEDAMFQLRDKIAHERFFRVRTSGVVEEVIGDVVVLFSTWVYRYVLSVFKGCDVRAAQPPRGVFPLRVFLVNRINHRRNFARKYVHCVRENVWMEGYVD